MKNKRILVTGGSGLVGKSLQILMPECIYISSKDYDLREKTDIISMFEKHKPDVVIHLAAKVGGIIDNINNPVNYFEDNILMNSLLMKHSYQYGVKRFISILSTCIYPDVSNIYPMTEIMLHEGPPTITNFSYGYAKRCLAVQTDMYNKQYDCKYQYLIPCNLYGEFDKYGENSHFVAALLKKIIKAKQFNRTSITLYGTGNPLRQFMYAPDLAWVIKYCIENNIYENMNVATKEILSIKQMAEIAIKVCDASELEIKYDSNYPDGQFRKDVSIDLLNKMIPTFVPTSFEEGIYKTFQILKNANNF
jgi:GDP-L-fucose synthase